NIGVGVSGAKQIGKKLLATLNYMSSTEPDFGSTSGNWRHMFDLIGAYTASPKWAFIVNGDYWHQSDFLLSPDGPAVDGKVYGIAGYARRTLNKKQALSLRAEILNDPEGAAGTGAPQTVWETTLTFEHRVNKYAILKAEYRHDSSNVLFFPTNDPLAFSHG